MSDMRWPGLCVCDECWKGEVTTLGIMQPQACDICKRVTSVSYVTLGMVRQKTCVKQTP